MITCHIIAHWEISVIDLIQLKGKLVHRGGHKLAAKFPETKKMFHVSLPPTRILTFQGWDLKITF